MENKYKIGEKKYRHEVGLKGKTKVTWLSCKKCGTERWVMPNYIEKNICASCTAKDLVKRIDMNSYNHKAECKCHRCRMGKGYFRGDKNPAWKGGTRYTKNGYVYEWIPLDSPFLCMAGSHKNEANYIMQHRLVMAKFLNRPLTRQETVHHKNGIRDDNRIDNLELWSSNHQAGQRLEDQIKWAINILEKNGYSIKKQKTQTL